MAIENVELSQLRSLKCNGGKDDPRHLMSKLLTVQLMASLIRQIKEGDCGQSGQSGHVVTSSRVTCDEYRRLSS